MKVRPGWIQQRNPEASEQCWAPPNATPQFKALKGCRSPTVLQFSSHSRSHIPCSRVLSMQHCLLCDSRSLPSLPSASTVTCCSHGAQMLSSISTPPAHFISSCRSVPAKALCWALPTASAQAPFWGACFDNCLSTQQGCHKDFWDNGACSKWEPW